ncbi:sodium:proton exchanger [Endozoicomonas montiporae]|uniref:Sodium:proton exchanger n=2 Tax=Endozoicomonas montiporae TaxID=1027273 RepID=A0A081N9P5_9GAMM|nr:cation:proton antiporter [Endozoicomonas montiporae]AMO55022.1 sodium/hydrogen exchanger [Endozoicomonas montiporae CL-33]KEQ15168.1 sodium:proton exchanger [Endozoicomonas montiporae]
MFDSVFLQVGLIVGLASLGGVLALYLKQPLIVAFIVLGVALGPSGISLVEASSEVELFAKLGISLLLFVVGLKLDIKVIRTVGPVALASGLGQVFFTSVIGFLIAIALGMPVVSAVYVALALTFSSTIIIVKILSDKREVNTLHGRIAVGFLIVQDIVVVLVMIGLMAVGQATGDVSLGQEAINILLKGVLMLVTVALLMRFVLPGSLKHIARSSELLVLFSIGWAVLGACAGHALGFSKEVGAFLAGISIASTPYREQIAARLVSLRDFLLLFFFIELGSGLDMSLLSAQIPAALLFSVFVLLGNPVIVMAIMGLMGYRKRTGFLAGLTVAQISEFSLILAALGLSLGHISENTVGLITLVGLITISVSTYMMLYSQPLFERLSPYLSWFEKNVAGRETASDDDEPFDMIMIGIGRFGAVLAENLQQEGKRVLAIDYDPRTVEQYAQAGFSMHYGDIEDPELIAGTSLDSVQCIISTIRDRSLNKALLENLNALDYQGSTVICVDSSEDVECFEGYGSDYVLSPYAESAHQASDKIIALSR